MVIQESDKSYQVVTLHAKLQINVWMFESGWKFRVCKRKPWQKKTKTFMGFFINWQELLQINMFYINKEYITSA